MLRWLFKPQDNINYNFVFYSYLISTTLGISLMLSEAFGAGGVEYSSYFKGLWIVFAPYFPMLVWVIYIKAAMRASELKRKKD